MENLTEKKMIRAKQKVEDIKKFYKHLVSYILVNLFLTFVWSFSFKLFGDFIVSNQFDEDGFKYIPFWLIWGIFLVFDALKTFDILNFHGKDWEEIKIEEFMKEEK